MNRRDQVGQLLSANPLIGAWLILLLLALLAGTVERLRAQDLQMPCPAKCREITYNSWDWYVECYPLPRKCSANPEEELTLTQQVLIVLLKIRVF